MKLIHYWYKLKSILGLGLSLAKANFKLRNEGSFLGVFWYLLEPFLLFVIILSIRAAFSVQGIKNYPLYLLLGLIMYNFFSGTTSKTTGLITGNANFIKSMKINHESLVVSQVLEGVFSHFFEIILFIGFMIYFEVSLIWILVYPIIFGFFILFVLGLSFILSTIGVFVNDLNNVWRVLTRLLFFVTPLFYIAEKKSLIYKLNLFNPLFYFITIARDFVIFNLFSEIWIIMIAILISIIFFIIGVFIFEKYKDKFAELV